MGNGIDPWELATVLSRLLSYFAMLAVPGAALVLWLGNSAAPQLLVASLRSRLLIYVLGAAALGILAVSMLFLLQVGAINQQGLPGMFDRDMGAIIAQTAVGEGSSLRLSGFFVAGAAAAALFLFRHRAWDGPVFVFPLAALMLASVLFAWSFTVMGHVANLGLSGRLAGMVHILAVAAWVGALYPLSLLCRAEACSGLGKLMHQFGQAGWVMIGALLLSGGILLWQLLDSPAALIRSSYGLLLVLKLSLVTGLLALGALNKFRLVPALNAGAEPSSLLHSIRMEMVLATAILLTTAVLTTITGPM